MPVPYIMIDIGKVRRRLAVLSLEIAQRARRGTLIFVAFKIFGVELGATWWWGRRAPNPGYCGRSCSR